MILRRIHIFFSNDVILFSSVIQWIGVREHVQETPIAYLLSENKNLVSCNFSLKTIQ